MLDRQLIEVVVAPLQVKLYYDEKVVIDTKDGDASTCRMTEEVVEQEHNSRNNRLEMD